ncbi:MAG TPA: flagellar hook-associated protein FlgL [Pirellulales bacterium]
MNIIPVPSSRVSDTFSRQQLLQQMQQQQQTLNKLQTQISSGSQFTLPSDNPSAALSAVGLQSMIAQNTQYASNLSANASYLNASDTALSQVNTLVTNIQGVALGAVGATATAASRQAAAAQVQDTMSQIVSLGNTVFNGRYLFAGSMTNTQPFVSGAAGVQYMGNNANLLSYADTGNLFATNVTGDAAFGGFSDSVQGSATLTPTVTANTPLADLNGGQGVAPGRIVISDGTHTSTVDLSSAATVGDVVKMIEANPPPTRSVTVQITNTRLALSLDPAGGGALSVADVGNGTTAAGLGIAGTLFGSPGPLVGGALNPKIGLTTPLSDILGTPAQGTVAATGSNNNVQVQANSNGTQYNGAHVVYVNDAWYQAAPGVTAGNEFATYSATPTPAVASLRLTGPDNDLILTATAPGAAYNNVSVNIVNGGAMGDNASASFNAATKTLTLTVDGAGQTSTNALITAINGTGVFTAARDASSEPNTSGGFISPVDIHNSVGNTFLTGTDANTLAVHIQSGVSTANDVVQAINKTGAFTAALDLTDPGNDGSGAVTDSLADTAATATLAGGGGANFDPTGIQIVNGGKTYNISFSGDKTIQDLLNSINNAGASVLAQINAAGTGINVQSRLSGSDFSIGENGGQTATQLGIRTFSAGTPLSSLNYGQGVHHAAGGDITIQRKDGVSFTVDISSAKTIGDVLNLINTNATNTGSGIPVVAQLNTTGNGIELVDNDPSTAATLSVTAANSSTAAQDLGLIPVGSSTSGPAVSGALATATVVGAGANNDLIFQAKGSGTALNGVTVSFVNTGAAPGSESVSYDSAAHTLTFDVGATTTANTIINVLQNDPVAGKLFTASLAPTDGGAANNGSGVIDTTATGTLAGGTADTLSGSDTNPQEVSGIFTALSRLQTALQNNDVPGIQRAMGLLTDAQTNLSFTRAQLGANEQAVSSLQSQVQTEATQLQGALSNVKDVNMAQTISDLVATQTAFQASLQVTALISKLTLLNYL